MNERELFHKAIIADPQEKTTQLVFADWLDEQNEPFEAALRRSEIFLHSERKKKTIWIDNLPYNIKTKYVTARIDNIEYSVFQSLQLVKMRYENVLVASEKESAVTNISLYSIMWEEGSVKIEAFAD